MNPNGLRHTLSSPKVHSTQAMEFQFIFLHGRIAINHFLTKIGLETTLLICEFCGDGKEGLAHLLPNLLTFLLTCT